MINKKYHKNQPVIIGLAGKAATGKTSVAEHIVPKAQISTANNGIMWDHIFFALPLYELVSIKNSIRGLRERDRQLYAIHNTLYDLFGGSPLGDIPDYNNLTELVNIIWSMPLANGVKPRTFLQKAGDYCREYDPDCFAKWAIRKSIKSFRNYEKQLEEDEYEFDNLPFAIIISDVRFENEAEAILKQPNGIVICYETSDDIRNKRMLTRDGHTMTEEQMNHRSEKEIDMIKEMSSAIIDSSDMTIEEQASSTINIVKSFMGMYAKNN